MKDKTNPIHRTTWRELHDEFYQPELLRAEADTPPEVKTKDRTATHQKAGKSTKPGQQPDAPKNGMADLLEITHTRFPLPGKTFSYNA